MCSWPLRELVRSMGTQLSFFVKRWCNTTTVSFSVSGIDDNAYASSNFGCVGRHGAGRAQSGGVGRKLTSAVTALLLAFGGPGSNVLQAHGGELDHLRQQRRVQWCHVRVRDQLLRQRPGLPAYVLRPAHPVKARGPFVLTALCMWMGDARRTQGPPAPATSPRATSLMRPRWFSRATTPPRRRARRAWRALRHACASGTDRAAAAACGPTRSATASVRCRETLRTPATEWNEALTRGPGKRGPGGDAQLSAARRWSHQAQRSRRC